MVCGRQGALCQGEAVLGRGGVQMSQQLLKSVECEMCAITT